MTAPVSEDLVDPDKVHPSMTNELSSIPLSSLVDRLGRVHTSLRISVTDRCNIRCQYCMPAGDVRFMATERWLSFDSIARLVRVMSRVGIRKIRLTGGEPLMRPKLHELIEQLRAIEAIDELALTTNGMLLADQAASLRSAGLMRINISLDTLQEATFFKISRRPGLEKVFEGIDAAIQNRLEVRLNSMVLRDLNFDDVIPLVEFARDRNLAIRFIEFMPLDADRSWKQERMVSGAELRKCLSDRFGELIPMDRAEPSQPATDYRFADGVGVVGFIDSVSAPFCSSCNRLRLTADGVLRNCLFGKEGWDVASHLQENESDAALLNAIRECVKQKHPSHGISEKGFQPPSLAMYQIGG